MKYKLNKLYNMDCMEAMKQIPDNYFELAIVDPTLWAWFWDIQQNKQNKWN